MRPAVPVAVNKSKLSNAERKRRVEAEARLHTGADKVKPPKWLSREAKREFRRLAKLLLAIDLVTNVDVDLLAVFADTLINYQTIANTIAEEGETLIKMHSAGSESVVAHPLLTHRKQLVDQLRVLGREFGLTPASRAQLALTKEPEPEVTPFDKLFGNVVPMRREAK